MNKKTFKKIVKKDLGKNKDEMFKQKIANTFKHRHLSQEDNDDLLESASLDAENIQPDTTTNWSQAQDRSEDFINETDPFIQELEKTPKIPRDNRL